MASRGRRLRNRSPREAREVARQALRPGCEELAVTDPAQMPVREARPREPKTATVERREASVPRHKRVHARLLTQDGVPHGCSAEHPNVSRRSAHPSIRVSEAKLQDLGAKTRRGNEMGCLKSE